MSQPQWLQRTPHLSPEPSHGDTLQDSTSIYIFVLHLTLHVHVAVYGTPKLSNMDDMHVMMLLLHYI